MPSIKSARRTATADATDAVVKNKNAEALGATADELKQQLHMDSETFWERLGFRPYSVQATFAKLVARITLYAIGIVASIHVISLMSAAMVAGGWPLFIIAVCEIVGIVLAFIGSWKLSDTVVDYIAEGRVSQDIKRLGGWISAKFNGGAGYVKSRMSMH